LKGDVVRFLKICGYFLVAALVIAASTQTVASDQNATNTSAATNGSINGTVTDKTGAVLPGATVSVSNGTGFTRTANSNGRGEYSFTGLPAGTYSVTISAPAFKDFRTEGMALSASQSIPIDAALDPAGSSTSVNVEGQKTSQVETETSQIVGNITQKELVSLGLNGRNFTQLIALTPGVSNQTGQDEAKVGITGSVRYSVNGGRVEYNSFNVDGGDVLNAGLNGNQSTLTVYPSLDSLSEVQVLTSNYGAMYGRSASGTVLATTKSGTNQFHGVAYEFIRNEFFNARNYFDQTSKAPLYRRNDFGATLGGPIYIPGLFNTNKDKTYFFASEEFRFERSPVGPGGDKESYNQAVPSLAERNGIFSDVCPFTTPGVNGIPGGQTTFFRQNAPGTSGHVYPDCPGIPTNIIQNNIQQFLTFPGNQVPIDPNATAIMGTNIIPLPNSSKGCNSSIGSCFNSVVSPSTYWREELFRIDHSITPNMRATFRYIHDSWDTTTLTPQWGTVQNSFPTIQSAFTGPGLSMLTHLTNTISPTLLNEFIFSYTTDHIHLKNIDGNGVQWQRPADLTAGYLFNNGFGGKVPGIVIGGTNHAYGGNGFAVDPGYLPWQHSNPTYNFRDDLSKVIGRHTVQTGVQVVIAQRNELNQAVGANTGDLQGLLAFSNISSFNTTGNSFADFLLARPNGNGGIKTFQQDSAQGNYYNRYSVYEPYVQDDWRVNSRLILNLGLRVSLFGNWHEKYNNVYNWVPSLFNQSLAAQTTVDPFTGGLLNGPPSTCTPPPGTTSTPCSPIPVNLTSLDPRITNGLERCGVNGVPAGCMKSKWFNPAPRIGFAWDPRGDGKTSIRAGYGMFFHHGLGNEANTGSLEGSAPLVLDMTQNKPFTYECIGGAGPGCGASGAFPLNVTSIPTQSVWPYVQQWSFSVQRELTSNTIATLGYVGSKGTHLTTELQINQLAPVSAANNPFLPGLPITTGICDGVAVGNLTIGNTVVSPASPAYVNLEAACFGTAGKNFPDPNTLRTFAPGFGQIFSLQNVANSDYNAMQVTLRRATGPLTLGVAYTYSHSIDDSSDRSDTTLVNAFDLASNRASSNFDQRHLLNISYVYKLPSLSARLEKWGSAGQTDTLSQSTSQWAHVIADGWELSGITSFQSGTPFSVINGASGNGVSVLDNAGVANGTSAGSYPDVVGDPHASSPAGANNKQSVGPTLGNPAAFVAPEGLTFGDAGRNFLNNPSRLNFDVTALKHFRISEGSNLELRVETFNLFNHTQFRIYDPDLGNTGSNTISCYGGPNNSAGDASCLAGNSFLHPVDAHRSRTMQFGLKYSF
jgi:Carboxypeptidase regulatory-like domain/TonB-dependent Receptor Plug Domain